MLNNGHCSGFFRWTLIASCLAVFASVEAQTRERIAGSTPDSSTRIEVVSFHEYFPEVSAKRIRIEDGMLKKYVEESTGSAEQLQKLTTRRAHLGPSASANNSLVRNPTTFEREILETIAGLLRSDPLVKQILPNGTKDLDRLSVHDALFLSGKVVADRLAYYEEMTRLNAPDSVKTNPTTQSLYILDHGDPRPDEAKRVDALSADEIFSEKRGICRNYAPVNQAVFTYLKGRNENLRNTYMTVFIPGKLIHSLAVSHAWNRVITVIREKGGDKLLMTYVDPTWLDSRKDRAGELEAYDALDPSHFGRGVFLEHVYLCDLFSALGRIGDNPLLIDSEFVVSPKKAREYQRAAMTICLASAIRAASLDYFVTAGEQFLRATENLASTALFSAKMSLDDPTFIENVTETDLVDYRKGFEDLETILGNKTSDPIIDVVWITESGGTEQTDGTLRKISIAEIYAFVEKSCGSLR